MSVIVILVKISWPEPMVKSAIFVLLNGHAVKLLSKCLCLYPMTWAAPSLVQRSSFWQWAAISVEMYN